MIIFIIKNNLMASSQSEELFHVKQFVFVQKISTMLTNCGKV